MQNTEILNRYVKKDKLNFKELKLKKKTLHDLRRIVFIGSGNGYASAVYGASAFERLSDCLVSVYPAGEFRFSPTIVDRSTLLIAVSVTGCEEDVIASIKRVRAIGGKAIVVCSDKESTVAKNANFVLESYGNSFEDVGFVLSLLAIYVGRSYGFVSKIYQGVAIRFAEMLSSAPNSKEAEEISSWLCDGGEIIACGRGADYSLALELSCIKGASITPCYFSQLPTINLENKKILAIVSSKDFLNDIMFYLDIAKQRGERLLVIATDDVAEIMPKITNIVSFHGSLPIFNPIVIAIGLCRGDQWSSAQYHSSNNATDERCSPLLV